jgi:hypothetical protein
MKLLIMHFLQSPLNFQVLLLSSIFFNANKQQAQWPLVREQTIQTEQPPLVGEVSANFCG